MPELVVLLLLVVVALTWPAVRATRRLQLAGRPAYCRDHLEGWPSPLESDRDGVVRRLGRLDPSPDRPDPLLPAYAEGLALAVAVPTPEKLTRKAPARRKAAPKKRQPRRRT